MRLSLSIIFRLADEKEGNYLSRRDVSNSGGFNFNGEGIV